MDRCKSKGRTEAGQPQGPEGSLGKLAASRVAQSAARVHTSIMGNGALLTGEGSLKDGVLAEVLVSTQQFQSLEALTRFRKHYR